jgi:hypothetical protein
VISMTSKPDNERHPLRTHHSFPQQAADTTIRVESHQTKFVLFSSSQTSHGKYRFSIPFGLPPCCFECLSTRMLAHQWSETEAEALDAKRAVLAVLGTWSDVAIIAPKKHFCSTLSIS